MDQATLEGIRFRHLHVEEAGDADKKAARAMGMAFLSHLDRKDLLDEIERLRREIGTLEMNLRHPD